MMFFFLFDFPLGLISCRLKLLSSLLYA
jgi:hypothetical protein